MGPRRGGGSAFLWLVWTSGAQALYAFVGCGLRFDHRRSCGLGLQRVVILELDDNLEFGRGQGDLYLKHYRGGYFFGCFGHYHHDADDRLATKPYGRPRLGLVRKAHRVVESLHVDSGHFAVWVVDENVTELCVPKDFVGTVGGPGVDYLGEGFIHTGEQNEKLGP